MIRQPPRSTHCISSAASDVYKRQGSNHDYLQTSNGNDGSCVAAIRFFFLEMKSFYCDNHTKTNPLQNNPTACFFQNPSIDMYCQQYAPKRLPLFLQLPV
eukprot:TRINITY_DN4346_c0_g1_i2.p5 TRINITY_DN4346_c0_g1~~TRINITY_DN4346_c0_g1_i2.p5  ORF type:complete len:100 (+),score=11.84 TRINITY_DN4346_c0_g1_i2:60-359(+)